MSVKSKIFEALQPLNIDMAHGFLIKWNYQKSLLMKLVIERYVYRIESI